MPCRPPSAVVLAGEGMVVVQASSLPVLPERLLRGLRAEMVLVVVLLPRMLLRAGVAVLVL